MYPPHHLPIKGEEWGLNLAHPFGPEEEPVGHLLKVFSSASQQNIDSKGALSWDGSGMCSISAPGMCQAQHTLTPASVENPENGNHQYAGVRSSFLNTFPKSPQAPRLYMGCKEPRHLLQEFPALSKDHYIVSTKIIMGLLHSP